MKRYWLTALVASLLCCAVEAQELTLYKDVVKELSSARYQGRGYARDGVRKAGKYIYKQFVSADADEVQMQPFTLDVNTFPGKMRLSINGRRLTPGEEFTLREFSPAVKGEYPLYFIEGEGYDSERIFADLAKPAYKDAFVVCDFWEHYKHREDFARLENEEGLPIKGVVYTWKEPLKFYKADAGRVAVRPVVWVMEDLIRDAQSLRIHVDNRFYDDYATDNVIARINGERHDSCYVFTAHYDHLGNLGRKVFYPGANDNASGTAAIITLAKHYAQHQPKFDMVFVAFSGEDTNLHGSEWYVDHPIVPLDRIRYLFNIDMVGDDNPIQYVEVSNPGSEGFALMESLNGENHYFKAFDHGKLAANSDHWPFAQKGVPCILFENESGSAFPFYHTHHDDMEHFRTETYEPLFHLITDFIQANDN